MRGSSSLACDGPSSSSLTWDDCAREVVGCVGVGVGEGKDDRWIGRLREERTWTGV